MNDLNNSEKPLLLVFPHDVMAHYLRCLRLATYLQPYFSIQFLYSANYHSFVTKAGFNTFECAALHAEKVHQGMLSFDFSWLNEKDLDHIYRQQVKVIEELHPAAVLGDMTPTLKMAAEKTGTYCFSLLNGYMSRHYAYVRRMPKKYPLYKLFNLLPNSLFQYITNVGENLFFHDMHRPFSVIRKRERLSPKYSYLQEMEGDANLLCDLPEFFPQKDLPANYYFLPPLYHQLTEVGHATTEGLDRNKKTLLISMGSTGDWKKMAFLNNAHYHKYNIITAADNDKVIQGANVFAYPFISSSELFRIADLIICHGGNGTIYQALSYGIPVLCKTSHLEQDYNVDGLERLEAGRSIDDIESDTEYFAVIEEWIQKKGNKELSDIQKKIAAATDRFQQITDHILSKTYFSAQPVFETVNGHSDYT